MSYDDRILDRHLRHWRDQGLLDDERMEALRRASAQLIRTSASTIVRTALALLGGLLLLAGLVLIVAENWDAIPRFGKLGGWAAIQVGLVLLAADLGRRFPGRPYLSEAFALVAGGFVLGGIALVSQIYHLNARPPNGIWVWLALVLPAAWLLERRATAAVVFCALVAALSLEIAEPGSWLHAARADNPWLFLAVPLLAGAAVSWLPRPLPVLRGWLGAWVLGAGGFFLLVFGAGQALDRTELGGAWALAAAGLGLALVLPARVLPAAWDHLTSRLVLVATLLPWVLVGGDYGKGDLLDNVALGTAWVTQLLVAVLAIRAGARSGSGVWVNLGYVGLLAGILTRYFDFFGNYLEGGTALAATGVLILFVVFSLERARRHTLAKEALR